MSNEDDFIGAQYGTEPGDCEEYFVAGLHNGAKQERLVAGSESGPDTTNDTSKQEFFKRAEMLSVFRTFIDELKKKFRSKDVLNNQSLLAKGLDIA